MAAAKTRIYRVDGPGPTARLVEAATVTGAIAHVAKTSIKARVASQTDLYEAGAASVKVEVAGEEPATLEGAAS